MSASMIDWLYGLQHFGVKLGLDNIRGLLRVLERPELSYPSILLGGTNGKGSVAAMCESILRASGRRTGMFTSPHLVRPNERIQLDGCEIESAELDLLLRRMRDTIAGALDGGELEVHPSFFEVVTATALEAFRDHEVDAALLEVGLGGRLDATNAVDADVSVIVTVDYDHQKTLGGTIEAIAAEKAGIIKPGKPIVSGVDRPQASAVLERIAGERGAEWLDARRAFDLVQESDSSFALSGSEREYTDLRLALPGRHQWRNARVAVAAMERFFAGRGWTLDPDAVRHGLAQIRWPGRLQWIPEGEAWPRLLLDAAHNTAGMESLIEYLRDGTRRPDALVFGATRGKPVRELLEPLSAFTRRAVITRPPVDKGLDPEEVAQVARSFFESVEIRPFPSEALRRGGDWVRDGGFVLVTGSLYLIGEVLGLLEGGAVPGPVPL